MKTYLHLACGSVYLNSDKNIKWVNVDAIGAYAKDRPDLLKENSTDVAHYYKKPYVKKLFGHGKRERIVLDVKANVINLSAIENESVDGILNVNLIDHLKLQHVPMALREWRRILKLGGLLITDVGDMIGNVKMLLEAKNREEFEWALRLIYCHSRDKYDSHHWGFTPEYLELILKENGFGKFEVRKNYIKHVYPAFQVMARKVK